MRIARVDEICCILCIVCRIEYRDSACTESATSRAESLKSSPEAYESRAEAVHRLCKEINVFKPSNR